MNGVCVFSRGVVDYVAMKSFKENTQSHTFEFYEYIVKCLVGVSVGYLLLKAFPGQSGQYSWLLISILLSITHDNNSKAAHDRMRGNIVGSLVGLVMFLLHNPPNLLTVGIGVVVTIALCFNLDLIGVCRTALVGFIIVMIYEEAHSSWTGAIYRMVSVVLGCLIGLVINYTFRKITLPMLQRIETEGDPGEGGE
jgi:uncharacterized membrane protein YgaE (UPF0421/DUF939 family)